MKFTSSFLVAIGVTFATAIGNPAQVMAQEEPTAKTNSNEKTETLVAQGLSLGVGAGENYIGAALLLGAGEDSIDPAIISKIKIFNLGTDNSISLRSSFNFIDGDVEFRIPLTIDWRNINRLVPFAGGGIAIDESDVDFMLTGGFDYRINPRWTANAALNLLFLDNTDLDVAFGIGYNF